MPSGPFPSFERHIRKSRICHSPEALRQGVTHSRGAIAPAGLMRKELASDFFPEESTESLGSLHFFLGEVTGSLPWRSGMLCQGRRKGGQDGKLERKAMRAERAVSKRGVLV